MKHKNWILCAVVVVAAASTCVIEYAGGRRGMPLSFEMLPAQVLPVLIALLAVGTLFVITLISFFRRQLFRRNLCWFALSLVLFVGGFGVAISVSNKFFRAGLRHRILSTVSSEELRQIARASHEALPTDKFLPGPEKWSLWNESEHRKKWNALTESTALGKLDPSLVIFNHSDTIELSWGGALIGHWGVIIQINGKMEGGDIAQDIKTVVGAN